MAKNNFSRLNAMTEEAPAQEPAQQETQIELLHQQASKPAEVLPEGYIYKNGKLTEARSKHLHILVKPSTYNKLKVMADNNKCSVNEIINEAIDNL